MLGRKAAHPAMTTEGFHSGAVDGEDITVGGIVLRVAVAVIEDLDFNGAEERHAGSADG